MSIVLLDIGGVLMPDSWEKLLLDPKVGVATYFGRDHAEMELIGTTLWHEVATDALAVEEYWWGRLHEETGCELKQEVQETLSTQLLLPLPGAREILSYLNESGVEWGIISDNTNWWYARAARLLGLEGVPQERVFLSCKQGVSKKQGLYEAAVEALGTDLITVDDREGNLAYAQSLGIKTIRADEGWQGRLKTALAPQ